MNTKKLIFVFMTTVFSVSAFPQKIALAEQAGSNRTEKDSPEITFQKTTHNFGVFDVSNGLQSCYFVFTNTGKKNLTIIQAVASCGCTVPEYPKGNIPPGAKDSIKVTYDGTTRRPGVFSKTISLRTNAPEDISRLYIKGEMVDSVTTKVILDELDTRYN